MPSGCRMGICSRACCRCARARCATCAPATSPPPSPATACSSRPASRPRPAPATSTSDLLRRRSHDHSAEEARQPDRPPHRRGHREPRRRTRRDPRRGARLPRRERRGVHPQGHRRAAQARADQPRGAAVLAVPAGLARRHRGPLGRQDPREHGDRPQRHARPVGLDARPEDPLDHLGVGQRVAVGAVEALAQRAAPHLHQRDRQGQRPRLRHHARRRGPALVPALPGPAAVELHQRLLLRVRHRRLRPRARQVPAARSAGPARSSRPAASRC